MNAPTLLVLAAGMGSRYGGLKQMDAVGPCGETIIDYSIFDALRAGFAKAVFVIRKDIEQEFRAHVGAKFEGRVDVEYVFQQLDDLPAGFSLPQGRTKPWGTVHAVLAAARAIHEPFAVLNADDFYGAESFAVLSHHLQSGTGDCAMVAFALRNTLSEFGPVARGVCRVDESGCLTTIREYTAIEPEGRGAKSAEADGTPIHFSGDELVSMNMWGFGPTVFADLRESFRAFLERAGTDLRAECYLPTEVNELVLSERARVRVLRSADAWFGVTYREDREQVVEKIRRLILDGRYPERLWP